MRSRRVGPGTYHRLMADTGDDAAEALRLLVAIASEAGVRDYVPCPADDARHELDAGRRAGAVPVFFGDPGYPAALAQIEDAPAMLWAKGELSLLSRPAVAMVGARNASSLGLRMARTLARELGETGLVVVSGLARGIDGAAHKAALDSGTVAVVAGGVDVIYPREHAELAAQIAASGLLLSEMPPGLQPQARHFPRRNRIISGLARAVVVVEAASRSGSLITARDALDQGREVLAVPGHPFDGRAAGCNLLIRDGATLVRGADDVLAAVGMPDGAVEGDRTANPLAAASPPATVTAGGRTRGTRQPGNAAAGPDVPPRAPSSRSRPVPEPPTPRSPEAQCPPSPPPDRTADGPGHPAHPAPSGGHPEKAAARAPTGDAVAPAAVRDGQTTPLRERILALLGPAAVAEDQLLRDLAQPPQSVAGVLLELELEGVVERQPGGLLARLA